MEWVTKNLNTILSLQWNEWNHKQNAPKIRGRLAYFIKLIFELIFQTSQTNFREKILKLHDVNSVGTNDKSMFLIWRKRKFLSTFIHA